MRLTMTTPGTANASRHNDRSPMPSRHVWQAPDPQLGRYPVDEPVRVLVPVALHALLRTPEADILAFEAILCRAAIASADHRLSLA